MARHGDLKDDAVGLAKARGHFPEQWTEDTEHHRAITRCTRCKRLLTVSSDKSIHNKISGAAIVEFC